MTRKFILPLLALMGALFGLYVVFWSQKEVPVPPILFPPPVSPYVHSIAAAGIIEASSQNISVGSPFTEVISDIFVEVGQKVKTGDPLFQLDLRAFKAQVDVAEANLEAALIDRENKKIQFSFYQRLKDTKAVSEQLYQQSNYALLEAEENVKVAQGNLQVAKVNVERSIIRSPMEATILQVNSSVGEIAPAVPIAMSQTVSLSSQRGSLIVIGRVDPLQVRVDIDEEDIWRFERGAKATAFVRGNSHINFPLNFHNVDPYVVPKSSFTGAIIERVDTRVLQVLFDFNKEDLPIYPGQVLDIFIESKPYNVFSHDAAT